MKNLFIDANVWLSLYHFTKNDIKQFRKLRDLKTTGIKLFIPSQTRDEVQRNRDAKLKDALSRFKLSNLSFPEFCKSYSEYEMIKRKYDDLKQCHSEWCDIIINDINNQELPVDKVIKDFFEPGRIIECTNDNIMRAELRYRKGNPPGKKNSLGDAINWECLLSCVPDGEDLFFVSNDKDYRSDIDNKRFNLFLMEEWREKKKSDIHFYDSLSTFIKGIDDIELQTEREKDELINGLRESHNFTTTHAIIRSLGEYSNWNEQQIDDLCSIAISNTQVLWILSDDDVLSFYDILLTLTESTSDSINELKNRIAEIKNSEHRK